MSLFSSNDPPLPGDQSTRVNSSEFTSPIPFQNELFPELPGAAPTGDVLVDVALKNDPEPANWSEQEKEALAIDLIALTWEDVLDTLRSRLKIRQLPKNELKDYEATLGWLLGYWVGSIPLALVLQYENALQKNVYEGDSFSAIQHNLLSHPVIAADIHKLRIKLCGGELFAQGVGHE